ncbi:MAG: histidine phosphatase family protein [Clostridia bacterium]|nr:histidine phosphatase family protein [Clostridia bacterium]
MTEIYLVRHVQAMGNVKRVFQGHTDEPPSPLGEKQLEALGEYFKDKHIDAAYHSPLIRTTRTCLACVGDKDIPVTAEPGLIEIFAGEFENRLWTELFAQYPEEMSHWGPDYQNFKAPGGESFRQVYDRAIKTVNGIVSRHQGETVLLATHGGFSRAFLTYVMYGDIERMSEHDWVGNASVTRIVYEDGKYTVTDYDCRDFMPEELQNRYKTK